MPEPEQIEYDTDDDLYAAIDARTTGETPEPANAGSATEQPTADSEPESGEQQKSVADAPESASTAVELDERAQRSIAAIQQAEERARANIARERELFEAERQAWQQQSQKAPANTLSPADVKTNLLRNGPAFLRQLGIDPRNFGALSKSLYYASPEAAGDPNAGPHAQMQLQNAELLERLERLEKDRSEHQERLEKERRESEERAAHDREVTQFMAQAAQSVGERKILARVVKDESRFLDVVATAAGELSRAGKPISVDTVLDEAERQQKEYLSLYGFDPYAMVSAEDRADSGPKDQAATTQTPAKGPPTDAPAAKSEPPDPDEDPDAYYAWIDRQVQGA